MLRQHIDTFESHKFEIAHKWAHTEKTEQIFTAKSIDIDLFEKHYAVGVIEYFIGVLRKEKALGNCPIMHTMLQDFANHHISSQEIFFICAQFKRTMIDFAFDTGFATKESIDNINYMLDENFGGVIDLYDQIIHASAIRLTEYTNAIDAATIIFKTDPEGTITHINHEYEHISGYSRDELIGLPYSFLLHPDTPDTFSLEVKSRLKEENIFIGTLKNRHKDGSEFYLKTCLRPIRNPNGEIDEYISINQDITEVMKSLEYEHKVNMLKDDFLRNISHEIRTPLNAISGSVSLLGKRLDDPKLQQLITLINNGTNQLLDVMTHILDLSQLSSGTFNTNISDESIYAPLGSICERFRLLAEDRKVILNYQIDEHLHEPVRCDLHLIERILSSLIDNGVKFNREGGKVAVKIAYAAPILSIQVKDNGIGISPENQKEIFKPFHQIDSSTIRAYNGMGIGLALLKKIIDFLGGTITLESEEGKGSLFAVTLPLS